MRAFFSKSIIIMMVAFCYQVANAQSVITTISTADTTACREYLVSHSTDTIRSRFANPVPAGNDEYLLGTSVYLKENTVFFRKDYERIVKVVDTDLADRLFEQWLDLNLVDSLLSGHSRDYEWIAEKKTPETAADSAMRQLHEFMFVHYRMDTLGVASPRNIRYPKWGRDKYGPYLFADGTWQACQGRYSWTGDLGYGYDTQNGYWKLEAKIGYGRSDYSTNAVHDGDPYWVFRTVLSVGVRPVKVDANDMNRLFIIGGAGYERYSTDSKPSSDGSLYQSKSNYFYPHAGVRYERRFPKWGFTLFITGEWRTFQYVIQDEGRTGGHGSEWIGGLIWTICRHPFKTTSIR